LRVADVEVFYGPNPYATQPVTACTLEVEPGDLSIDAFRDRMTAMFPRHDAVPAELPERVTADFLATTAGRLAASLLGQKVGLELGCGAGIAAAGKSQFWFEHFHPFAGAVTLKFVLTAIASTIHGNAPPAGLLRKLAGQFAKVARSARPNFESLILIETARRRGLPYLQIGEDHGLWQFGWGARSEQFWITSSNLDGMVAQRTAHDKAATKRRFAELGIPTPVWRLARPRSDLNILVEEIGWPCVVKPPRSGGGKGVSADIRDMAGLQEAVKVARAYETIVIVESHVPGSDYRLMVIDGELVAAVRREPPSITGDGKRTIAELFALFNVPRQRPERESGYLTPVADDAALAATLARQGVDKQTVLAKGRSVLLRTSANRSTGGTCTDVMQQVHPEVAGLAVQIASAFGFRATGIDYITPDISRPPSEAGGGFLELNTTPGMRVLLAGGMGEDELGALFLGTQLGRIPIAFIVAEPDVRDEVVASLRDRLAPTAAAASPDWAQIGSTPLPLAERDPVQRVTALLRYPTVDRLTIIWGCEELARYGLPVDAVDKTIVQCPKVTAEWLAVLKAHSEEMDRAEDASGAVAILEGKSKDKSKSVQTKASAA
jgi:cyanophycin synthetase